MNEATIEKIDKYIKQNFQIDKDDIFVQEGAQKWISELYKRGYRALQLMLLGLNYV
jgi:hypothetical protein